MMAGSANSKLKQRMEVAEGTMAFTLERPAGFEFTAGQSIDVTLLQPRESDEKGNTRPFSIASAPTDPDLVVATRMRDSAFKRTLKNAAMGMAVKIEGPFGSFTLHKNASRPAVFLAGGIGITPFHSIIRQASQAKLGHQLYLFYSNRRPEDAAFMEELGELARSNRNFHFVPTMTQMEDSKRKWEGERGFIDGAMIRRHIPNGKNAICYLAGPAAMVTAMRQVLTAAEVDEDDIRSEEFSGY